MVSFIVAKLMRFSFALILLCSYGSAFAREYNCDGPELSREQIISIVERERRIQPGLPPRLLNPKITVRKVRCNYLYREDYTGFRIEKVVIISEYGVIINFTSDHSFESEKRCPDVEYSKEELAGFLAISRKKYPDLPPQPDKYVSETSRVSCFFLYYEVHTINNIRTRDLFFFDSYGKLFNWTR